MKNLPPNAETVFCVYLVILYFAYTVLFFIVFIWGFINLILYIIIEVFGLLVYCVFDFVLLKKYYKSYKYSCSVRGVSIMKGYLLKRKITVLKDKVLYAEIYSNPLQRHFSLCSLGIFCAGTGRVLLSQIYSLEAIRIREALCEKRD